jgi:hypothetical protein
MVIGMNGRVSVIAISRQNHAIAAINLMKMMSMG